MHPRRKTEGVPEEQPGTEKTNRSTGWNTPAGSRGTEKGILKQKAQDAGRTESPHSMIPSLAPSQTPAAHSAQDSPTLEPVHPDHGCMWLGVKEGRERVWTRVQPLSAPCKPRKIALCCVLRHNDKSDGRLEIPH